MKINFTEYSKRHSRQIEKPGHPPNSRSRSETFSLVASGEGSTSQRGGPNEAVGVVELSADQLLFFL